MMEDYKVEMGKRMKIKRKELNLTQENMSELLDISTKHYSGVERGVAGLSIENLIMVSDILGVNLDYLVKGDITEDTSIPDCLKELYFKCPKNKRQDLTELLTILNRLTKDYNTK